MRRTYLYVYNFFLQPLMKRFQCALRRHLDKQNEKISLELRELVSCVILILNISLEWCEIL